MFTPFEQTSEVHLSRGLMIPLMTDTEYFGGFRLSLWRIRASNAVCGSHHESSTQSSLTQHEECVFVELVQASFLLSSQNICAPF